jgi:DNA-binding PadR family transcriptional regulator
MYDTKFGGRRRHHPDHEHDHDHDGPRHEHPGRGARGRGGPRGGMRGGPRGRAQRGDVRAAALILLAEGPMHGYQLMQAIADRTGGAWRPSPGAVYPTLSLLEDEGLLRTEADGGRKLATLTEAGRAYLADPATAPVDPFAAMSDEGPGGGRELRRLVEGVHVATRTIGQTGTPAQVEAARALLEKTRRELYLILAEDSGPDAT